MPAWLIQLLVSLAIKFGIPWLVTKLPWIPTEVVSIINELLENLKDPKVSDSAAKKMAKAQIRAAVNKDVSVGRGPDLV